MDTLIQIPCCHEYCLFGKRLEILYEYRVFDSCTFVVDDRNHIVTPFYPYHDQGTATAFSINPFCPHCKAALTALFESMTYSEVECSTVLNIVQGTVQQYLLSRSQSDQDGVEDLGFTFTIDFFRRFTRPYSDESVSEWVERLSSNNEPTYTPASDKAIDALERITATATTTTTTCAICLQELMMDKDEVGRRLPCKHEFHEDCIIRWLHTSHCCPLCRFELPTLASSIQSI